MKIAIDAMGGDFAPQANIEGALLASPLVDKETQIVLVGQEDVMRNLLPSSIPANIELVHAPEVIGMAEHPTKALPAKPKSSISIGFQLLKTQAVDAFCSAGNTGAMMVGSLFTVQTIPGISRPAIISYVPKLDGSTGIILDVGANTDCKPEHLVQFGEIGSVFCKYFFQTQNPKVALLNLGEEAEKGNLTIKETHKLMAQSSKINFVGNIEGRDLFNDKADVIVCDGFVGNIVIKMAESYYDILKHKNFTDPFFDNFSYELIGGTPILGINGNVMIAHGISNGETIKNVILTAQKVVRANIHTHIKEMLQK
ncbi:MAG: phosphate acyltransferase PlsX [Microscillaceae bacterium]|jgi:glycerol-3-phosphate acyltransferase PlsX|nr:phosphate acyltransferase PlsX [Microscillaceae bacterium]